MADVDRVSQLEKRLDTFEKCFRLLIVDLDRLKTDAKTDSSSIDPLKTDVSNGKKDFNTLVWVSVDGPRGVYEKTVKSNVEAWTLLAAELQSKDGKMTKDGFFYWLFEKADAIGRKRAKAKQF